MILSSDAWMWFSVRRKCCTRLRLFSALSEAGLEDRHICEPVLTAACRLGTACFPCLRSSRAYPAASPSPADLLPAASDKQNHRQRNQSNQQHCAQNTQALGSRSSTARTEPHIRRVSSSRRDVLELQLQLVQPALFLGQQLAQHGVSPTVQLAHSPQSYSYRFCPSKLRQVSQRYSSGAIRLIEAH